VPPLGAVWFVPEAMPTAVEPVVRDRRGTDKPPSGTIVIPPEELERALALEAERAAEAAAAPEPPLP